MSVRVLGFDISTCTGYAFWDTSKHHASIEAGVIELPDAKTFEVFNKKTGKMERKQDYHWDDYRVSQVGPKVVNLIRGFKPDLVLIEERLRFSKTGDGSFAMTNAIHGAVYSHCMSLGILFGTVYSQSWRAVAYNGAKQPLIPDMDRQGRQKIDEKTGKPKFKPKDWGDIAVEKCESLGIKLPPKKAISHNAAEAALIAMIWRCRTRISVPEVRAHDKYISLLQRPRGSSDQQRNERQGAAA